MWVLIIISVVLLVWGFATDFGAGSGDKPVDVMFYWTYVMIGIAAVAVILVGLWIGLKNNPKSLVKLLVGLVVVAAICAVAYLIAPGKPAVGLTVDQPTASVLKLTDTILIITLLTGGLAILSIIAGEIIMSVRNK